jgi:hypothetical protein
MNLKMLYTEFVQMSVVMIPKLQECAKIIKNSDAVDSHQSGSDEEIPSTSAVSAMPIS